MQKKIIYIFPFLVLYTLHTVSGQQLSSKVVETIGAKQQPVAGATLRWLNLQTTHTSESDGTFNIPYADSLHVLIVSHPEFESDTIHIYSRDPITIVLTRRHELKTIEVMGEKPATYYAPLERKTEVITSKELEKAACCDLSTCFSSNSSVQPEVTDIIADTHELTMLGLSGIYTHVLIDNVPGLIQGVNQNYGVTFIPGPLINEIYITKGANSVLQGYESISGLVNVLFNDGSDGARLFCNVYMNRFQERQINIQYGEQLGNWNVMVFGHSVQKARRVDEDGNSFLDLPLITRYSLVNKWSYLDEENGKRSSTIFKATDEERIGGQIDYIPSLHSGGSAFYGQSINNRRYEALNKTEFLFEDKTKIAFHSSVSNHTQDAYYGTTFYHALQNQFLFDFNYGFEPFDEQTLIIGASYRLFNINEEIQFMENPLAKSYAGMRRSRESIPGLYAEHKMRLFEESLTMIGGMRFDHHNEYGSIITPRFFAKYEIDPVTTIRATVGTGFHSPHVFSENTFILSSSRDVKISKSIEPEIALNFGGSVVHLFSLGGLEASFSLDLFHTEFTNQFIADYDSDVQQIRFENVKDKSGSNNILTEFKIHPLEGMDAKAAYTFSDVYQFINAKRVELPFISRHKIAGAISYSIPGTGWSCSVTLEWFGSQRLPDTKSYPVEFQIPERSKAFTLLNVQTSYEWNMIEGYIGIENLFDFVQSNPIINPRNPFSRFFEPNFSWGPVRGSELYAGIRLHLFPFEEE